MLRVVRSSEPRCALCGKDLPRYSGRLHLGSEWACPRCFYLDKFSIDPENVEGRASKGRSMIVVPRIEFHPPSQAPTNALPL